MKKLGDCSSFINGSWVSKSKLLVFGHKGFKKQWKLLDAQLIFLSIRVTHMNLLLSLPVLFPCCRRLLSNLLGWVMWKSTTMTKNVHVKNIKKKKKIACFSLTNHTFPNDTYLLIKKKTIDLETWKFVFTLLRDLRCQHSLNPNFQVTSFEFSIRIFSDKSTPDLQCSDKYSTGCTTPW